MGIRQGYWKFFMLVPRIQGDQSITPTNMLPHVANSGGHLIRA